MLRQGSEIIGFSMLAVGILLTGFTTRDAPGSVSGGSEGLDTNTVVAVAPAMAEMVEAWDAPPEMPQPTASLAFTVAEVETEIALPSQPETIVPPTLNAPSFSAPSLNMQTPVLSKLPEAPTPPVDLERIELSQIQPTLRPKVAPTRPAVAKPPSAPAPARTQRAATAQQNSAGRQAQAAAGSGGGSSAGNAAAPAQAAVSNGRSKQLEAAWHARISRRIQSRQRYPRAANGQTATAHVRISITASGQLRSVSIAKSSGIAAIDAAAIDAVKRSGKFPAAPRGVSNPRLQFNLPMVFRG